MTGSGTEGNPYIIQNVTDLQSMNDDLSAYYKLGGDIDASETETWNGGAGFVPIGRIVYDEGESKFVETPFTGGLDGDIHVIKNLYINRPTEVGIGLFGITSGDDIKEVGLVDSVIIGMDFVGGLIGANLESPVLRCFNTGSVDGNDYVGGLIGITTKNALDIPNGGTSSGVKTISNSYARGEVSGNEYVGGLIGANIGDYIYRCFSSSSVVGDSNVGGLIGSDDEGTVIDSFWDTETSGQEISAGGTGRTTRQMTRMSTYYAWHIQMSRTHRINEGYPFLYWQSKR